MARLPASSIERNKSVHPFAQQLVGNVDFALVPEHLQPALINPQPEEARRRERRHQREDHADGQPAPEYPSPDKIERAARGVLKDVSDTAPPIVGRAEIGDLYQH